jgi:hypothetical protein
MLLYFMGSLAIILTILTWKRPNIIITFCAFLSWFSLFMWGLFSGSLDLVQYYSKFLVWIFLMMSFVPWLLMMDTEIKHEALVKGKKVSWSDWGKDPEETTSSYDDYKGKLKDRLKR